MCGIFGYISNTQFTLPSLMSQLSLMKYRGPDNQSELKLQGNNSQAHLGHLRLSIIDLNPNSNQPFKSTCGNYTLVFNGEIYNFKSLKEKHLRGVACRTESDTEVLLNLYIKYGEEMLLFLEGMYAFAIFDNNAETLFVARDPLGIKPLYYYRDNNKYIFSSEIKPLLSVREIDKSIDPNFYYEFMVNGFVYEPDTGYKNIKKVYPGSSQTIHLEKSSVFLKENIFWSPSIASNKDKNTSDLITYSINQHLISDVPLGLFFSGGVDSSVILTSLNTDCELLTLKSPAAQVKESGVENDFIYAQKIAEHLNKSLTEVTLPSTNDNDFFNEISHIAKYVEEPTADYTFVASQRISQLARQEGNIVMLSGMGADEIFAGYPRYTLTQYDNIYKNILPFAGIVGRFSQFSKKIERFKNYYSHTDFGLKYTSLIGYFSSIEIEHLLKNTKNKDHYIEKITNKLKPYSELSNLKKAMILDKDGFLSHNFIVADKSSMLESIEVRVPLATHNLFDHAFSIADKELMSFRQTKKILKKQLERHLPKNLIYRKKAGFNPPMDTKIKALGKKRIYNYCDQNQLFEIIDSVSFTKILDNHFQGKSNNTYKIYVLLFLSAWYNKANA